MTLRVVFLLLCMGALTAQDHRLQRGPFSKAVILDGTLRAHQAEIIAAPRGDTWQVKIMWMIKEGSQVNPGDPVARFDNSGMLDSLQRLESDLRQKRLDRANKLAEGESKIQERLLELKTKEIDYKKAKLDGDVPAHLLKAAKYQENQMTLARAEKELNAAKVAHQTEMETLKSEIAIIDLDIKKKQAEFERNRKRADDMEIKAGSGGIVIYETNRWEGRKIQEGDTAYATQPILSIPNLNTLEVETWVSETELPWIELGQSARLRLDAYPETEFTGKVIETSNKGEMREQWGKAGWFRVRISIDNIDLTKMRPGMSIRAEIQAFEEDDVLLAPVQCLGFQDGEWWLRPSSGDPIACEPVTADAFYVVLAEDNTLKEGLALAVWEAP